MYTYLRSPKWVESKKKKKVWFYTSACAVSQPSWKKCDKTMKSTLFIRASVIAARLSHSPLWPFLDIFIQKVTEWKYKLKMNLTDLLDIKDVQKCIKGHEGHNGLGPFKWKYPKTAIVSLDAFRRRAKRDMIAKSFQYIPQNAKLSTLFNRIECSPSARIFKYFWVSM